VQVQAIGFAPGDDVEARMAGEAEHRRHRPAARIGLAAREVAHQQQGGQQVQRDGDQDQGHRMSVALAPVRAKAPGSGPL
jgi:hypothetical protein